MVNSLTASIYPTIWIRKETTLNLFHSLFSGHCDNQVSLTFWPYSYLTETVSSGFQPRSLWYSTCSTWWNASTAPYISIWSMWFPSRTPRRSCNAGSMPNLSSGGEPSVTTMAETSGRDITEVGKVYRIRDVFRLIRFVSVYNNHKL